MAAPMIAESRDPARGKARDRGPNANADEVALIIFPFGFYILDGKMPVHVGNDLEAQNAVCAWAKANPEQVRLGFDEVGAMKVLTVFLGWDRSSSPSRMDQAPLLFETTITGHREELQLRRRYSDYDAALAGHAELVALSRRGLR
ncbi:hypothetical protein ABIB73_003840 [Bradyrhizobium sp. F1.4.3]|uniref:hypothetical protein n=1 Tax=Bradyrhizobium sp. F1.4.3 TaxID=3156356 RepID=UPI0033912F23